MTSPSQEPAATPAGRSSYEKPKFVGDAAPVGGMPLSRMLDVACYLVTGITVLIMSSQVQEKAVWTALLGLAVIGYGIKVAVTRTSYWRHTLMYLVPIGAVIWLFSSH